MIRTLRETTLWRKTWPLALVGTVAALLLVGCTSAGDDGSTPIVASQPAPTVQPTPSSTITAIEDKTDVISEGNTNVAVEGGTA